MTGNSMDQIEVNNQAGSPIFEKDVQEKIFQIVKFLKEDGKLEADQEVDLSVAFVDEKEIAKLNRVYRKKNEATDVLSFAYEESGLNGEIVLCYNVIELNAKDDQVPVERELNKNIIHGILHILGFEHGEEMFRIQELYASKIKKWNK